MKKALFLLPLLLVACTSQEASVPLSTDATEAVETIVEELPQELPAEITYPTMREYVDLLEWSIRGHFDFDAEDDVPLEDFIAVLDEENYYVKLDYSTDEIPLESKELDAAITVFLKNDGSHLIAFQGRLCPRSFFPCSQVTDFFSYEPENEGFKLKSIPYIHEPIPHEELHSFTNYNSEPKDPRAYLGYYFELPRFDATLRLVESGYAFTEDCEIDFFDAPRKQIYDCEYYPATEIPGIDPELAVVDGELGMHKELIQTFDHEYTPGFTLQEFKWNGEEFIVQ